MLQHPTAQPPNEAEIVASSQMMTHCSQKTVAHSEDVLKCPRCDSMNTKFCYYNNYSLSQPRHFCKNCRRYWTKGGALRNVPIGGGCRKNKRVKHRSADANSLVSLDETTSNMLASMSNTSGSSFLSNFSSSSGGNLSKESPQLGLALSRLEETLRSGERSGIPVANTPIIYGVGDGRVQLTEELIRRSCSHPTLMSTLPSFDSNLMPMSYPRGSIKPEHGMLYNGSDFRSIASGGAVTDATSLADHFSTYNMPIETSIESGIEAQLKIPHQTLAMHLLNGSHNGEQSYLSQQFEGESKESLRLTNGKPIELHSVDERPSANWQAAPSDLFLETAGNSHFWRSTGWPDYT